MDKAKVSSIIFSLLYDEYEMIMKNGIFDHHLVDWMEKKIENYGEIEEFFKGKRIKENRCDLKSTQWRLMAMSTVKESKALELFNKSICFAATTSQLSYCYANRSELLFRCKRYRECLVNIELARQADYPKHLRHKLDRRQYYCLSYLLKQSVNVSLNLLQLIAAENVPGVAGCLQWEEGIDGIVTNTDLEVGDFIAMDKPFCVSVGIEMQYMRCSACHQDNHMMLIPCDSCCSAMFCSQECKQQATATFHKFECPIIDFIYDNFSPLQILGLRLTLTVLNLCKDYKELKEFSQKPENQKQTVFDLDSNKLTKLEEYRTVNGVLDSEKNRPVEQFHSILFECTILKFFIMNYTPLGAILSTADAAAAADENEMENFFVDLLLQHQLTAAGKSAYCIPSQSIDSNGYSIGLYPILSLLTHSCAPNVAIIHKDSVAWVMVLRPIKAGDFITLSYSESFFVRGKDVRLADLQIFSIYDCNCEACTFEYPMSFDMDYHQYVPIVSQVLTMEDAFNYRMYCEFLQHYDVAYPCKQIHEAQGELIKAIHLCLIPALGDTIDE